MSILVWQSRLASRKNRIMDDRESLVSLMSFRLRRQTGSQTW
ncbi:hypothetical protein [[Phormidium] sp. ETS-05]|nr:hypothetical protein [[Phormidium] sp. ETS-05]